jgi:6-phosphogluconate dehydrogenase (decarboxylating)
MATLSTQQLRDVAAYWANHNFVGGNVTANFAIDHIQAAAQSIDNAFDTTINQAQSAGYGPQTVINAINANIPAPFSTASLQQKINLACNVLEKRAGLI